MSYHHAREVALTCRFAPQDSWFFRESRPHESVGVSQLGSLFPPPPSTLLGALKSALGERLGIDWRAFRDTDQSLRLAGGETLSAYQLLGNGETPGALALQGVWLRYRGEALYPVPRGLLIQDPDGRQRLYRLAPGAPVACDLGRVRLPALPAEAPPGCRPLEQTWITATGLAAYLAGGVPAANTLVPESALLTEEPRLGIGRDSRSGTVKEGLLYQTRHLRLSDELEVCCQLGGVPATLAESLVGEGGLLRLGGEGRQAALTVAPGSLPLPAAPSPTGRARGLILTLLTPARLEGAGGADWLPEGSEPALDDTGANVWRARLAAVDLEIHSAVIGKAQREGGWDMKRHQPRPVSSLVPAGSSYFCRVPDGDLERALAALHGAAIGQDQHLGRGRLAAGLWLE